MQPRVLALGLLSWLVFPVVECAECLWNDGRPRLCGVHAKEEKDTLQNAATAWKKASSEERVALLQEAAALTKPHAGVASKKVADFLARGLQDPEPSVVEQSIRSLLDGQHPDTVLDSLTDALERAERACNDAVKHLVEDEVAIGYVFQLETAEQLLLALGQLRDERSLEAITRILKRPLDSTPGRLLLVGADACMALGSPESMRVASDFLERLDKAVLAGKTGPVFKVPAVMTAGRAVQLSFVGGRVEDVDHIAARMMERARALDLPSLPEQPSEWKAWMDEHSGAWGNELGRLTTPVSAVLPEPPPSRPLGR